MLRVNTKMCRMGGLFEAQANRNIKEHRVTHEFQQKRVLHGVFGALLVLAAGFAQLLDHTHVLERAGVAAHLLAAGNLAQQSAHDLAGSGFGQRIREPYFVRACNRANFLGDVGF